MCICKEELAQSYINIEYRIIFYVKAFINNRKCAQKQTLIYELSAQTIPYRQKYRMENKMISTFASIENVMFAISLISILFEVKITFESINNNLIFIYIII